MSDINAKDRKEILQFVKMLDGGDDDDGVFRSAVARNWIAPDGAPTQDGRQMIRSFDTLKALEHDRA